MGEQGMERAHIELIEKMKSRNKVFEIRTIFG
jgi:hypothetical protein